MRKDNGKEHKGMKQRKEIDIMASHSSSQRWKPTDPKYACCSHILWFAYEADKGNANSEEWCRRVLKKVKLTISVVETSDQLQKAPKVSEAINKIIKYYAN